jgi:hypothetical protein
MPTRELELPGYGHSPGAGRDQLREIEGHSGAEDDEVGSGEELLRVAAEGEGTSEAARVLHRGAELRLRQSIGHGDQGAPPAKKGGGSEAAPGKADHQNLLVF